MGKVNKKVNVVFKEDLTKEEESKVHELLVEIFGDMVDAEEAEEDFIHDPFAYILLKDEDDIVGCLQLHESAGRYKEKSVRIGGFSIGIKDQYRGLGWGNRLIQRGMEELSGKGLHIGFLAAAPGTVPLYKRYGFSLLNVPYTWENVNSEIKESREGDGMIIDFGDGELFSQIQQGENSLHVGRGYW
jgi:predicted GNAT family N-acyltransferase